MSDDDKKNDLTRIEDLSEFLHQGDEEIDKLLADIDVEDEDSNFEDDSNNSDEGEITLSSFEYETPTTDLSEQDDVEELEASDFEEGSFDDGFFQNEDDEENEDIGELDEQDTADINLEFSAVEDLGQEGHDEEDSDDDVDDVDDVFFEDQIQDDGLKGFQEVHQEEHQEEIHDEAPEGIQDEVQDEILDEIQDEVQVEIHTPPQTKPEDFKEVQDFSAQSTYGKVAIGGNPPFSLLIQGIRPQEHDESILAILNEHGLLGDNEDLYRQSLESGQLLIAHIGEYSAIFLAGKLRRYCRTIKLGLAHEIHQSTNYNNEDQKGLTGPLSIEQNKARRFHKSQAQVLKREDIILSSSHFIPGFIVTHSLGPMQINAKIDANEFDDINSINLIDFFEEDMREKAFAKSANAITSIHFTINQQEIKDTNYIIILAHGDYVYLEEHRDGKEIK